MMVEGWGCGFINGDAEALAAEHEPDDAEWLQK